MNTSPESNDGSEVIHLGDWHITYQHSDTSDVGGIGSVPLSSLRHAALVVSIAVSGTVPFPAEAASVYPGIEARFVFPSSSPEETVEDEYARIRGEIVASGLPALNDDDVRAEIRERKGDRRR